MKVTMQQLIDALEQVKVVAAQKPVQDIDFANDTPEFNAVLELVTLEGLEGSDSIDAMVAAISGALKAALMSVPRVISDIDAQRRAEAAPGNSQANRYAMLAAMGAVNKKKSAELFIDRALREFGEGVKTAAVDAAAALAAAAAAAAPAPAAP